MKKKTVFDTHCLLRRAGVFFFFSSYRKKLQINQSNNLYQTGKRKEKKRKKERSTRTTFHANSIVRFVLQAVRKFSFHNNKKFSWKSNYIVNALSYISFRIFDYSLFVISQEDEVVGSPSKGQVSKACNYWKHL